jgi:protein-disulfide isomerase
MAIHTKPVQISPKDIWVGEKDAPVVLVEFGDYESEDCAKAHEIVKGLLMEFDGKLKFVFRHFPLTKIHQRAMKAAEASVAAAQEGKFWEMHEMLFENRRKLGTVSLKEYAREIGIKNKRFLNELIESVYGWAVRNDLLEGLDRGVREVPTFFINGELYSGRLSFKEMKTAIEEKLQGHMDKKQTA